MAGPLTASTGAALTSEELVGVAAALAEAGEPPVGPLTASLISGGRSNLTYLLSDGSTRWVLRTPPRHGRTPSAHDVAREHRVTAALVATDVPVPRPVVLVADESVLGGPFAIAAHVVGRTVQTRDALDGLDDAAVAQVVSGLLDCLVALHRTDHVAIGLERFGRPEGYAERQLRRWAGQWELVAAPALADGGRELAARLAHRLPRQRAVSVVHGDFRIDNALLDLAGGVRVAAVVDWELATIGDPVADLAMTCAYRHPAFDLVVGEPSAWTSDRLPAPEALVDEYGRRGGAELVDWEGHLALACFKVAVIAAGIDHRRRAGSGSGPGFDTAGAAVPAYLELAGEHLRAAGG